MNVFEYAVEANVSSAVANIMPAGTTKLTTTRRMSNSKDGALIFGEKEVRVVAKVMVESLNSLYISLKSKFKVDQERYPFNLNYNHIDG